MSASLLEGRFGGKTFFRFHSADIVPTSNVRPFDDQDGIKSTVNVYVYGFCSKI